jgi:hypothetical protein
MKSGTLAAVSVSYADAHARVSICLKPMLGDCMGVFLNTRGVYNREQYAERPARDLTAAGLRRLVKLYGSDPDYIIWEQL